MKDHPDTPGTRDRDGGYLKEARRPVAATSPNDLEAYVALFIALLMACAVALIIHEVVRPTGTPGETMDSIVTSLWHAGAVAICFTVVTAAVIQGTRLAARRASQWLFKSSEEQGLDPEGTPGAGPQTTMAPSQSIPSTAESKRTRGRHQHPHERVLAVGMAPQCLLVIQPNSASPPVS